MTTRIRIRPRFRPERSEPRSRWGWVPLSLVFRRHRSPERPTENVLRPAGPWFLSFSLLTRHTHQYSHEGSRLFTHSIRHANFFLKRTAVERLTPAGDPGRAHPSAFSVHHRERSIETQTRHSATYEVNRALTTSNYRTEISRRVTADRLPRRVGSPEATIVQPKRLRLQPVFARPGVFGAASRVSVRHEEVRRQAVETVVEQRLARRLRKADSEPAPPPANLFAARSVEQVWRAHQPSPNSGREPAGPAAPHTTTPPLPGARQSADSSSAPTAAASAPGAFKLEGPAMERLADDVMKRIERHLRIERERRGM